MLGCSRKDDAYPGLWLFPAYNGHTGGRILRRSCQLFEGTVEYGAGLAVTIRDAAAHRRAAEGAMAMMAPPRSVQEAKAAAGRGRREAFGPRRVRSLALHFISRLRGTCLRMATTSR